MLKKITLKCNDKTWYVHLQRKKWVLYSHYVSTALKLQLFAGIEEK